MRRDPAAHPRVATTPMMLLRAGYAMRGIPSVPGEILADIVDEVFLPLVHGRGMPAAGTTTPPVPEPG